MQKIIKLPVGEIRVLLNGEEMFFDMKEEESYFKEDSQIIHPDGFVSVKIDMDQLHKGDKLVCEFTGGGLQDDGGGEFTTNRVGVVGRYTVGIGCVDTYQVERWSDDEVNYLSYELVDQNEYGYTINIIDEPYKYKGRYFYQIYFYVAWVKGTGDLEWELISCCTD